MTDEPLFPSDDAPAPYPTPKLSPTQMLTRRNQAQLARGIHPATLHRVAADLGTCGTCTHHVTYSHHDRTYHTCSEHRLGTSHSSASDIRVSWPACTAWEADA